MLNVFTYQNSLDVAEGKDKYCFRSTVDQILDGNQLVKEIVGYNSTLTDADVRAVLTVLDNRVKHFVNLGYKVELPFGYVFNKANGTVRRLNDGFVPGTANHRISAVFKFKSDSASEMEKGAVYKLAGNGYVIFPSITELCSKQKDGKESEELLFMAGAMLCVKGKNLSFDIEDEKQGVFLVDSDKNETRVEAYNRIGTNVVEAYVPSGIQSGEYEVKLVTKPGAKRYGKSVASLPIKVNSLSV